MPGGTSITIWGAAIEGLCSAWFRGAAPRTGVRGGRVLIDYPRFSVGEQLRPPSPRAEITLNTALPWSVVCRGSLGGSRVDLRGLDLRDFKLAGGAGDVRLVLPAPYGRVRVLLGGPRKQRHASPSRGGRGHAADRRRCKPAHLRRQALRLTRRRDQTRDPERKRCHPSVRDRDLGRREQPDRGRRRLRRLAEAPSVSGLEYRERGRRGTPPNGLSSLARLADEIQCVARARRGHSLREGAVPGVLRHVRRLGVGRAGFRSTIGGSRSRPGPVSSPVGLSCATASRACSSSFSRTRSCSRGRAIPHVFHVVNRLCAVITAVAAARRR